MNAPDSTLGTTTAARPSPETRSPVLALIGAWTIVGLPLTYGIYKTAVKASALFTG